jgi:putative intracellular protease/amidase
MEDEAELGGREEENYAKEDVPFMLETALIAEGAQFFQTDTWQVKVVVDGRLMTGQNPASAGLLAEEIVKALGCSNRVSGMHP